MAEALSSGHERCPGYRGKVKCFLRKSHLGTYAHQGYDPGGGILTWGSGQRWFP